MGCRVKPGLRIGLGAVICLAGLYLVWSGEKAAIAEIDCEDCDEETTGEAPAPAEAPETERADD